MDEKILKPGTRIKTFLGQEAVIRRYLGKGDWGEVFEVDYDGKPMALKWYKPSGIGSNPDAFYENLMRNVTHKAPSREFLWQQDVTLKYGSRFGYVMELIPADYYKLSEFMTADKHFSSFKTAVDAALHIVTAFRKLHNMGYSYLDLNNGNVFINPQTGAVLICDNDNVAPNKTNVGVLGKPRYMAPEIVVGNGSVLPDSLSDRFSMSVIIFIIICMQHPLEGRRSSVVALTPEIQEKLYGSQPLFIMDPNDRSNAPDPSIHKNVLRVWPYLPTYLKNFFIDAFSQKAFKNPNARPTELDWIKVLTRFRGDIVRCSCGNDVFLQEGKPPKCDGCGRMLRIPCWLSTKDYDIPAVPGALIFRCQLGVCDAENALDTAGSVIASRNDPSVLGIRNLDTQDWNVTLKDGQTKYLKSREVVALQQVMTLYINNAEISVNNYKRSKKEMPVSTFEAIATRTLTVFYVLDTSERMTGAPIAALNRAIFETIMTLGETAKQQKPDCKLKIAVLSFNSTCGWMQPLGPEEAENFVWEDLQAGGMSNIGEALGELDSKLSSSAFLSDITGNYLPIIIFMTDGYATDDYKKALDKIRENPWFKRGTKIGFAIGDDPDTDMIAEIVGNPEAVLRTDDLEELTEEINRDLAREIKFYS